MYSAFSYDATQEVQNRLRSNINLMMSEVVVDGDKLIMPNTLAEPNLSIPNSGHYAFIENEAREMIWRSHSAILGSVSAIPGQPPVGQQLFTDTPLIRLSTDDQTHALNAIGITVRWDYGNGIVNRYTFWAMEDHTFLAKKRRDFMYQIFIWLGIGGIALLCVQSALWLWVYRPFNRLAREIQQVEEGELSSLKKRHPSELQPIINNLNTLLDFQDRRMTRSRNTLQDLAHSLKTPLAVLTNTVAANPSVEHLSETVTAQVEHMNQTVSYQLQKAATAGQSALVPPIPLEPIFTKVINSLKKVYADKNLTYTVDLQPGFLVRADEGDLFELIGNLLDNASKWATSQILIKGNRNERNLRVSIEDDGPGISNEDKKKVLERGTRIDQNVPGHGVGMAIVRDIIEEGYSGSLFIYDSTLGGAKFVIDVPSTLSLQDS